MSEWLNGPGWHSAIFITATLLLLIGIILTAATRYLRNDQDPELENDLDAQTLSSLPDLRTSDLVGTDRNPDPRTPAPGVAASEDPRLADRGDGTQSLRPLEAGTPVLYGRPVARLTGAQRKRALRKGRIPRTLPGRVTNQADLLAEQLASSFGEPSLAGGVAPAPAAGQHHLPGPPPISGHRAGEPYRPPRHVTIYDPTLRRPMPIYPTLALSVERQAEAQRTWRELARMRDDAYAWLEQAA